MHIFSVFILESMADTFKLLFERRFLRCFLYVFFTTCVMQCKLSSKAYSVNHEYYFVFAQIKD